MLVLEFERTLYIKEINRYITRERTTIDLIGKGIEKINRKK